MKLGIITGKINKPNILLIAGNGRNVGKTFLACKIIRQIAKYQEVLGVKFSSHFHPVKKENVIIETNEFMIVEEIEISKKDSSRMLQAGASRVFFVMATQQNLKKAFLLLDQLLPETAVVCESGGLVEIIDPGLFLFVKGPGDEIVKEDYMRFSPKIIENNRNGFSFDISNISFINNRFSLKQI